MFFETGGTSMPARKTTIPDTLINPADQDLVKSHRTTGINSLSFAYKSVLKEGHYLAIFTFVEVNLFQPRRLNLKTKGKGCFILSLGMISSTPSTFSQKSAMAKYCTSGLNSR